MSSSEQRTPAMLPTRYVNERSGQVLAPREFWALAGRYRIAGTRMQMGASRTRGSAAALDPDGSWWVPDTVDAAGLAEAKAMHARFAWWKEHERDISVIPELPDSDLKLFRLLADIRCDNDVMSAAAAELHRCGIRDYEIAV